MNSARKLTAKQVASIRWQRPKLHIVRNDEPKSWHDTKPFLVSLLIAFLIAEGLYLWAHARGVV